MQALRCPSPNFGPRRDGLTPELIVLHYTAMATAQAALERLCDPEHEVSAHYLIHRDGRLYQLVDEDQRAWHAGAGEWRGQGDVNSRSVGIEIDNTGRAPFSEPQLNTLEALLPAIMQRWSIAPENIIGHSDMAPERKSDPGPRFPWERLARQGVAIWPNSGERAPDETEFLRLAAGFGYGADLPLETVLTALRHRFRPWATGALDARDMGIIADLAGRYRRRKQF